MSITDREQAVLAWMRAHVRPEDANEEHAGAVAAMTEPDAADLAFIASEVAVLAERLRAARPADDWYESERFLEALAGVALAAARTRSRLRLASAVLADPAETAKDPAAAERVRALAAEREAALAEGFRTVRALAWQLGTQRRVPALGAAGRIARRFGWGWG